MYKTLYLPSVLCLDRETITVAAHSDNGILQIGAQGSVDEPGSSGVYFPVEDFHISTDTLERAAGVVADLFFRDNAALDFA